MTTGIKKNDYYNWLSELQAALAIIKDKAGNKGVILAEAKALRKLRHPSRSRKLKGYLSLNDELAEPTQNLMMGIFGMRVGEEFYNEIIFGELDHNA